MAFGETEAPSLPVLPFANNLNPFCCHRRHFLRAAMAKGKQQSADGQPCKRGCCMRAVPCPASLGEGRGSDLACSTPEASLPSTSQSDTSSMPWPQLRNDCPVSHSTSPAVAPARRTHPGSRALTLKPGCRPQTQLCTHQQWGASNLSHLSGSVCPSVQQGAQRYLS